jgi:hypothetical protein
MSALQTLVQGVLALSQALAVGGVWRAIVILLLTKRGAGLCFHVGRCCRWESLRMQGGKTMGGRRGSSKPYEARPSLASLPCLAMHQDKLVAGWSQGMLPQRILQGVKGHLMRSVRARDWLDR